MTLAIYAQLAILALIDSTSIGTLLIPLWLLLRPDAKRLIPRILLYLGVLAGFYLVIGVAVLGGAGWLLGGVPVDSAAQIPVVQWSMSIAGALMLAYALFAGSAKKPVAVGTAPGTSGAAPGGPAVQSAADITAAQRRWQHRIGSALASHGGMVTLALIAGLLELPTMLPYLAAIGFLANSTLPLAGELAVLAIYCVVMLIPALVLLGLRVVLGARLDPFLHRVSNKLGKFSGETVLWVVGIVGFLLLRQGLSYLAPMAPWNPFK
ncbi:GAP family protein [Arthrobacter sp. HLT1-20]